MNPLPTHVQFWRRHFYVFDSTKILPGDILLSRSPKSVQSAVIRWATRSEYSHAANLP